MIARISLALLLSCTLLAGVALARTWTDSTGAHTLEAELVEVRDGKAQLKKPDGSVVSVPVERLSQADRRYLDSLAKAAAPQAALGPKAKPAQTTPARPEKAVPVRAGREAIEQELTRPTRYDFKQQPLREAIEALAAQHQVPVFIDRKALEGASVALDRPVTAAGQREPLQTALDRVLKPLKLAWLVRFDVLFITSPEVAASTLETRVYRTAQAVNDYEAVIADITKNVAPKSWNEVGGPGGISPWPPAGLVISQTWDVHRQLLARYGRVMQPVVPVEGKPVRGRPRQRQSGLLEALNQPIKSDIVAVPLREVVQSLGETHKSKIALDEKALEDIGIRADTPVTLRVRGVRLESVLSLLACSLGGAWAADEKGVQITSPEAAEKLSLTVTYDVRDLAAAAAAGGDDAPLQDLLESQVQPASWGSNGGAGQITSQARGAALQIRQSFQAHREIERLLAALRQARQR